jgi:hypothetical protein
MEGYLPADWSHQQEAHRTTNQETTTGAVWAKRLVQLIWRLQHKNWKERCNERHEQIVDKSDKQIGTLARQDWQAKVTSLYQHKKRVLVRDKRIFQRSLLERLSDSTQQLKRWHDTTKDTIKYMREYAQRQDQATIRDIRHISPNILVLYKRNPHSTHTTHKTHNVDSNCSIRTK